MTKPYPDNVRHLSTRGQVLSGIQDQILRERLQAGDPLPRAHDLARRLGVSSATVREALRVLESLGIVDYLPDGDTSVAARSTPARDNLLRLHLALSGFQTVDLMAIRVELERSAASHAATEASEADLDTLDGIVDAMGRPGINQTQFRELDCGFHLGVVEAGRNGLTTGLLNALRDAVKCEMTAGYSRTSDWTGTARRLAAEHARILTSIRSGDPVRSADAMSTHISGFYDLRTG
jgi:GntR family transcriptional repressor for pyruvate dehydrogenase complex